MVKIPLLLILLSVVSISCSSRSVLPESSGVTVSREAADKECKELGSITGTTSSVKGTQEQALADLKQVAANKGANYVVIQQYSAQGTAVTGLAYDCP